MNLCPHALSDGIPTNCEKYGGQWKTFGAKFKIFHFKTSPTE
jgi:hypothetical protein